MIIHIQLLAETTAGNKKTKKHETRRLEGRRRKSGQRRKSGHSSNQNSTNRYFMATPILLQINLEMVRARVESNSSSKPHHQLGNAYTYRQNRWVISLQHTFEKQVSLLPVKYERLLCNIATGQVFSDVIY